MPDISVIVPVRNEEAHLQASIGALVDQTVSSDSYEIIMVDNNCSDASAEMIKAHNEVRYVKEENLGAYTARNAGAAVSQSPVLAFTDSDCCVATDWLERITESLSDDTADMVVGDIRSASDKRSLTLLDAYRHMRNEHIFQGDVAAVYFGSGGNLIVRKAVFDSLGGFDVDDRGSDSMLVQMYVRRYGHKGVVYNPSVTVTHLEITNLWQVLYKQINYGRSGFQHRNAIGRRWLGNAESRDLVRKTATSMASPRYSALYLTFIVAMIRRFSQIGSVIGRFQR